ncbi:MAG: hypothetical protein ACSHYA_10050 [Opitutaceae bacterium]
MKPRSLRHRLEKASKLLVIIQKHTPDVDCRLDEDKGDNGHTIVDYTGSGVARSKVIGLGKDLESKGYRFTEKKSPWLGQTTYTGRSDDKATIVITLPISKDRMNINQDEPERAYSFAAAN